MKAIVGVLIAATLLFATGCAKTDWIDRTLVTLMSLVFGLVTFPQAPILRLCRSI